MDKGNGPAWRIARDDAVLRMTWFVASLLPVRLATSPRHSFAWTDDPAQALRLDQAEAQSPDLILREVGL